MGKRDTLVKIADGLYARYYPSGKRSLQAQFFYRGARCRETFKGLDPDVKAHVKIATNRVGALQDAIARDTFNYIEFFPESKRAKLFGFGGSRTVEEIGDSYLSDIERSHPHSTYRAYSGAMKRFVYPQLGPMRARDVSPEHIRDLFRESSISLKTARNYTTPLLGLFQRALDDGDISSNPMERVTVKRLIPRERHKTDYEVDPLSETEIGAFLAACERVRPLWAPYWQLAFYTGLRTSEQFGLEWADWRGNELDICRAIVERKLKDETKTLAGNRTLTLSPMAEAALTAQKPQTAFRERIFWNPNTKTPLLDYETSQRCFDYVCKAAKVRRRNQYQTRHSFATNMLIGGENPLFVAHQMGHRDLQMLFRVYAKWIKDATFTPRGSYGVKNAEQK